MPEPESGTMSGVRITEPLMFRVVVVVGVAMVPVILLAVLVAPIAGAILFGIEVVVALGYLIQRVRRRTARAGGEAGGATR